jgi:hypothetical protein
LAGHTHSREQQIYKAWKKTKGSGGKEEKKYFCKEERYRKDTE